MKTIDKKVLSCLVVIAFLMSLMSAVYAEDIPNRLNEIQEGSDISISNSTSAKNMASSVTIRVKRVEHGSGQIEVLDLESQYLPVVVTCENGNAPLESMKAQAVASRTFAMYKINHPRGSDFDVWDNESDQVYNPSKTVTDQHRQSVTDTNGIVLKYTGKIICAFYVSGTGSTAKYVTYNEGKSGDDITQTTLGWCTDPPSKNPYNRGCMGQVQANDLASIEGHNYQQIIRYFYGSDIEGFRFPTFRLPVPSEKYKVHAGAGFYDPEYLKNFGVNHLGEDILLDEKTPIRAIADGKIVWYKYIRGYASWDDGTSIAAVIEHDLPQTITLTLNKGDKKTVSINKICSIYGHIRKSEEYSGDKLSWKIGDPVKKGDIIGYINDKNHNGIGTEHLHFGIRLGGHQGYWVYYGRESADIPESNVKYFTAPSEIIPKIDIFAGLQYLCTQQNPDGSWGGNVGYTSLAALAFLNHGMDESDPTVSNAINYILSKKHADGSIYVSYSNYETSLAILPLVATHNSDYDDEVVAAKNYLVSIQNDESAGIDNTIPWYGGWAYSGLSSDWSDLSNTQWTMMGLDAANLQKTDSTWSKAETFVTRCQNLEATNPTYKYSNDGGFAYQPPTVACCGRHISYGSMTTAGIWGLRLAEVPTGDQRVQAGLNWLRDNYAPIETNGNAQNPYNPSWYLYYHLLGFAKALIMTGIPAGSWQETASQDITNYIVSQQHDEGHWSSGEGDLFATEQAILALQTRMIPTDIQRLSYLTFILHSNADLHVYDPLGRHVGKNYDTGGIDLEIPNATYTSNDAQNITIPGLETGNYRIVLVGTGTGEYTLNVTGGVGNETVSEDSYTASISEGEVHDTNVNVAMITWLTIHVDEPEPIDPIVPSATGTGNVSFIADAGTIGNLTALNESDLPAENPNVDFPHGLFRFNITGLDLGQTVNITIAFPQDIPTTAQYWKYHTLEGWYLIPMGSNDGDNIITITLQDGGMGDDDGDANGVIVDQGGPGIPVAAPNITSFAPLSPVNDTVCNGRTFNITVNQTVNVSWYVNGSLLSTNQSVTEANYTLHADVVRVLNVTAIAANNNGTDKQTWIWNVTGTCTPIGGFSVAILPKLNSATAGASCDFTVRIRNTQNFDEYVVLDLTLSGIPADYAANLAWFNGTTSALSIPAGEYRDIGLRMDIPDGISGYKSFGIIAHGTFGDSKDYGVVNVTLAP